MARTVIVPTDVTTSGVAAATPDASDVVNGNEIRNAGSLVLTVDNTAGAGAASVTFVTVAEVSGFAVQDVTVTVPMGAVRVFGHFPVNVFSSVLKFDTTAAVDVVAYQ